MSNNRIKTQAGKFIFRYKAQSSYPRVLGTFFYLGAKPRTRASKYFGKGSQILPWAGSWTAPANITVSRTCV